MADTTDVVVDDEMIGEQRKLIAETEGARHDVALAGREACCELLSNVLDPGPTPGIDGLVGIANGGNPRIIESRLEGYVV